MGLLGALADLDYQSIIDGNRIFTEFKGALTEQYVCQELIAGGLAPHYWSAENSRGEIDFLVQCEGRVYPIEVQAEESLRAKSLAAFNERYEGVHPRRFSLSGYRDQGWMSNVPLYAIGNQVSAVRSDAQSSSFACSYFESRGDSQSHLLPFPLLTPLKWTPSAVRVQW